jgi:glycosyltransferase involved in cell wall biosynthesis
MNPLLSVIIPARNEAQALPLLLADLAALREAGAEGSTHMSFYWEVLSIEKKST